jgi:hypothetical protein
MVKFIIPAACAIGAGAFMYMRKRHHKQEEERLDAELAASGYPGE